MEELLIPLGGMAMSAFIVYAIVDGIRRWYQQRTLSQFQMKLLDKIGSANDLSALFNTEAGARFLKGLTTEPAIGPQIRILRALQSGAVFAVLGLGLYLYGWFTPSISGQVANELNAVATIFFALGIGLLASAGLAYSMSKRLGVLSPRDERLTEHAFPSR